MAEKRNILDTLRGGLSEEFYSEKIYPILLKRFEALGEDVSKYNITISDDKKSLVITTKEFKDIKAESFHGNSAMLYLGLTDGQVYCTHITQAYNHRNELRYGWMTHIGEQVFTDAVSHIYDMDGTKVYNSWYSDDAVLVTQGDGFASTEEMLESTRPTFEEGKMTDLPRNQYAPFTNYWERYAGTSVYREHGRSPIHGEYSELGVTFDGKLEDKTYVQESYGRFAYHRSLPITEEEIVQEMERLRNESYNEETNEFNETRFRNGLSDFEAEARREY